MKSEKGITLISIIVYMIGIMLVISILASLSNFFFQNREYLLENDRYISEYNKFNMYFLNDVKNNKTAVVEPVYQKVNNQATTTVAGTRIIFGDGTVYTYREKSDKVSDTSETNNDYGIYRNKAKICTNISSCEFSIDTVLNQQDSEVEKKIITVNMKIYGGKRYEEDETKKNIFETRNTYVLKYW